MNTEEKIRQYLKDLDVRSLPLGRHDLRDGDYVNISAYTTKPAEPLIFEKHEAYIDGFYLLEGKEKVLLSKTANETLTPYAAQNDVGFYRCSPEQTVILCPDDLLIIDTDTYHAPSLDADAPSSVKKAIFKIRK